MSRFIPIGLGITVLLFILYLAAEYLVPEFIIITFATIRLLSPFIVAILLALFLEPLVGVLAGRLKMSRAAAAGASMLMVFGGIILLLTLLTTRLVAELIDLSVSLPRYIKPVQEFITGAVEQGKFYFFQYPELAGNIRDNLGAITEKASGMAGAVANFLLGFATGVPGAVLGIIVTFIATYFFIKDRHLMVKLWLKIMPSPWGGRVLEISRAVAGAFLSYVRAQAVLISLTTLQAIIGLYIIGAEYALTMGLLIGLFDVMPVLGPATIIMPWAVWAFISGNIAFGVKLVVLYLLIWVVRQTLEARVVAANLGLHPLAVLAAMYIGLKLIGIAGLIGGPILLIAVQAAIKAQGWPKS
ncbi:membrane protein [Desulfocucumis palustris]|uniref:Membrane protein n=1 Tax=Desulfocucumis palustris TaxID=1898651 RepID=A0A2L2X8Z7_9FIRM|nr:sporulation integral membrane protein YtvI [Desulfocucumis palustris]GBF32665.1 membrane protein [Desulfocucumis palustris]